MRDLIEEMVVWSLSMGIALFLIFIVVRAFFLG